MPHTEKYLKNIHNPKFKEVLNKDLSKLDVYDSKPLIKKLKEELSRVALEYGYYDPKLKMINVDTYSEYLSAKEPLKDIVGWFAGSLDQELDKLGFIGGVTKTDDERQKLELRRDHALTRWNALKTSLQGRSTTWLYNLVGIAAGILEYTDYMHELNKKNMVHDYKNQLKKYTESLINEGPIDTLLSKYGTSNMRAGAQGRIETTKRAKELAVGWAKIAAQGKLKPTKENILAYLTGTGVPEDVINMTLPKFNKYFGGDTTQNIAQKQSSQQATVAAAAQSAAQKAPQAKQNMQNFGFAVKSATESKKLLSEDDKVLPKSQLTALFTSIAQDETAHLVQAAAKQAKAKQAAKAAGTDRDVIQQAIKQLSPNDRDMLIKNIVQTYGKPKK